jgi:hypothetical protein
MANRYWILGTGNWSSANTANWSSSLPLSFTASRSGSTLTTVGSPALVAGMTVYNASGTSLGTIVSGSVNTWTTSNSGTVTSQTCVSANPGASVPAASDNVFFDANSNVGTGAFTVTMANNPRVCNDFLASGLDGVMTLAGNKIDLTVSGSLTFQATNFTLSYTGTTTFNATTTGKTVTTNGVDFGGDVTFDGVGGGWTLGSAFSCGTNNILTVTNGTFDLAGYTATVSRLTTATGTKNLTFNGGTLICSINGGTAFNNAAPTGFTTTSGTGTGTISMTSASTKTFVGGGSTFNCTLNQGGAGALTITGSNTFSNITNTVQPASVLFTAGTTSTFTNFNLSGTSGNLITIGSVTAASHTLSKASGTVSSNFLSISRSTATGGAGWYAANSTNGGNNSGWIFSTGNFLVFF